MNQRDNTAEDDQVVVSPKKFKKLPSESESTQRSENPLMPGKCVRLIGPLAENKVQMSPYHYKQWVPNATVTV